MDLLNGRCVRLYQGRFDNVETYQHSPLQQKNVFEQAGAEMLHIVDLDGAKSGVPQHFELIKNLAAASDTKIQVGGGVRTLTQARAYLAAGVGRVVIGSLAVSDPDLTKSIIESVGADHVTLAFDFKRDEQDDFWPAIVGWQQTVQIPLAKLFSCYRDWPELEYLCTDISRDGSLLGIDPNFYKRLAQNVDADRIYVSGGIARLDDLRMAKTLGLAGAIVGKAFYTKAFTLEEALLC